MLSRRKFLKDAVQGGLALGCSAFVTGDLPEKSSSDRIKMAIPPQFDDAMSFSEGLACVKINGCYGYINETGTLVIQPRFLETDFFDSGVAIVKFENGSWGYINCIGDVVNRTRHMEPDKIFARSNKVDSKQVNEGLRICDDGEKYGYMTFLYCEMVIEPRFKDVKFFSEGLAAVRIGSQWGFVDKTGTVRISPQFSDADWFHEGVAAVAIDGKWGYIDKRGTLLTPLQFDKGRTFSEGLAPVKVGNKWGYVGWI